MMWRLQLSRHRRARVWFDEVPGAGYSPTTVIRRVVSAGATPALPRLAAVELMVPRGATLAYGLLGAEWLDKGEEVGTVSVAVNRTGFPMKEPLVPQSEDVRIGLLDEYADAVFTHVEQLVHEGWRFGGELSFRWAAHSAAGSSEWIFSELSGLVARLLRCTAVPSEDDVIGMFS